MQSKNLIFISAVLLSACADGGRTSPAEDGSQATAAATDSVTAVPNDSLDGVTSATSVAKSPTFNGLMMVEPQQDATLSLTMGGKVHQLNVIPGQAVSKGQTVALIDNPEYISLQQEYLEAFAQEKYLGAEYSRQQKMESEKAASLKTLQQSQADWLAMRSRLQAAEARLTALGISPEELRNHGICAYLPVKAPIAGHVVRLEANLGKYLHEGEPLCHIINKNSPMIQLTVYEKDIASLEVGQEVDFRVNGMGRQTFPATIVSIEQTVDANDYSIKVYAKVKKTHPNFRPGMYVRARVVTRNASI